MPILEQAEALIHHYGPTVYFHPDEVHLLSSVSWFFNNGGLLCTKANEKLFGYRGSHLPQGGKNDGAEFWLGLLGDNLVKHNNLESAQLYVHVKPALGGTFTDIDMWVFYLFNGPGTFTVAYLFNSNIEANKHVGGWEHFTLRVSNFDGPLWSVYFSQHTDEKQDHASSLEFTEGNKPIVYSSKSGHTTFHGAGTYIQRATKLLGIGEKNVVDKSDMFIDASKKYQIIAAEYLGGVVAEPEWLQYMQEWGRAVLCDERSKVKEITGHRSFFVRLTMRRLIDIFPVKLYVRKSRQGPRRRIVSMRRKDVKKLCLV